MKKLFTIAFSAFIFTTPAYSLPGKTEAEITQWVKNHTFLSTWFQDVKAVGNYHLIAFRELQDHWFLDIFMYPDDEIINYVELILVKKQFSPKEPNYREDQRNWVNVECKDTWERNNETAQTLLLKTYGKDVALDFKNSKLTYKGPTFVHPYAFHDLKLDRDYNGNKIPLNEIRISKPSTELYLGNRYSYEVFSSQDSSSSTTCQSLYIRTLKWGKIATEAFQYNFNLYSKIKQQKDSRDKPADIEIK